MQTLSDLRDLFKQYNKPIDSFNGFVLMSGESEYTLALGVYYKDGKGFLDTMDSGKNYRVQYKAVIAALKANTL